MRQIVLKRSFSGFLYVYTPIKIAFLTFLDYIFCGIVIQEENLTFTFEDITKKYLQRKK